ncbi:MAG: hypothetical protein ACLTZY_14175 [Alistipes indistinctus]
MNNRLQWGSWRADLGVRVRFTTMRRYGFAGAAGSLSYDFGRDRAVWASATLNSQALVQFNRYYYSMPIDF